MPDDVYVNPDRTPYKGKYKWVPDTIPSAKETAALGWLSSTVERGSFRNDYYINTSVSTNYTIIPSFNSSGTGTTYFGNPEWPINYAFRKKAQPTVLLEPVPDTPFTIYSENFWWQTQFSSIAFKLSAITFEYKLMVDLTDPRLLVAMASSTTPGSDTDIAQIQAYLSGEVTTINVDFTKYNFGKIKLYRSNDTDDTALEYPNIQSNVSTTTLDRKIYTSSKDFSNEDRVDVFITNKDSFTLINTNRYTLDADNNTIAFKSALTADDIVTLVINTTPIAATGFIFNGVEVSNDYKNLTVKFDNGSATDPFDDIVGARIQYFYNDGPFIKFYLRKVMWFRKPSLYTGAVNIRNAQLPCQILAYAFNVNKGKQIPGTNDYFPNNSNSPSFYVKIFHPDDVINTRGFAHGINLRFFVPSFPIYTTSGSFTLGDLLNNINNPNQYWVVFVGPTLGKESRKFYLTGNVLSGSISGRLIRLNSAIVYENTTVDLQSFVSDSEPNDSSDWKNIFSYNYYENLPYTNLETGVPWLYIDAAGTSRTWYRIGVTDLIYGVQTFTAAFKGQVYTEKSTLQLEVTGVTNVPVSQIVRASIVNIDDPLTYAPLAVFTLDNVDDFFGSNIEFRKGQFKFNIKARSIDPSESLNTHLFIRMWLHPGEEPIDYNNPHQYRSNRSEIIFKSYEQDPTNLSDTQSSVKLNIGTPSSLSELIVTAPLMQEYNFYEILRYVDGLLDTSSSNIWNSIYSSPTTKLVIGLYTYVYDTQTPAITDINNPPTVEVELDPQYTSLETTMLKNIAGTLAASRFYDFDRSSYIHFNTDASNTIKVTKNLYGGGTVGIGSSYFPYDKKYSKVDTELYPNAVSYTGLATFETGSVNSTTLDDCNLCIVYNDYSLFDDLSVRYYADFVTKGSSFENGRVNPSTWSVNLKINADYDNIKFDAICKFTAFFVDRYGVVTERVFISPYLDVPTYNTLASSTIQVNYSFTINQPYFISGIDSQLILRVFIYPRSKNQIRYTDEEINNFIGIMNNKPLGLRITDLALTVTPIEGTSGLNKLRVVDTTNGAGSTKFYEDLQLVPSRALDSQQFWFYADKETTLKAQIIEAGEDFQIIGALYSPTWFVDLPKDMEIAVRYGQNFADSFQDVLWFRTVLADDVSKQIEDQSSATENYFNKNTIVATNGTPSDDNSAAVRYFAMNDPFNYPYIDENASGYNSLTLVEFEGDEPVLFRMGNYQSEAVLGLIASIDTPTGPIIKIIFNKDGGLNGYWVGPNLDLEDNAFDQVNRVIASDMTKVSITSSQEDNYLYIVGYVQPGCLVLKSVNYLDADLSGAYAVGYNYVIDGPDDIADTIKYDTNQVIQYPDYLSGDFVKETRSTIICDNNGNLLIAYVKESTPSEITARWMSSGGEELSEPFCLIDIASGTVGNASIQVYAPVLTYNKENDEIGLVFWCAGKIFFSILKSKETNGVYYINNIFLVAGDNDFSSASNPANIYFNLLISNGYLQNYQLGEQETDIHRQSVGFICSLNSNDLSEYFVYYKRENSLTTPLFVRKISQDGTVSEAVQLTNV